MVSDEQARAAAQEILARDEFTRWDLDFEAWLRAFEALADSIPSGWIDAARWLQELLIDNFLFKIFEGIAWFFDLFGVFGDSQEAIGWLAVCLLLGIAIVLAYRAWGADWLENSRSRETVRPGRSHSDAIAEAKVLAGRGRFLEAAHRVQLATLSMLIEFDWLDLARSDANRTLRVRVAESSLPLEDRTKLVSLVDRLERLWFNEPIDDADLFEEWIALDERLVRIAGRSRA